MSKSYDVMAGLSTTEKSRLSKQLVAGAGACGFPTELWTLARVGALLQVEFGRMYSTTQVWRVLRSDGVCFLNLGDSYYSDTKGSRGPCKLEGAGRAMTEARYTEIRRYERNGLKPKDLIGIPWRVALALQADGWWLRSDIVWHKPNPMPESVTDRCTKAHEYIFMLTKSAKYYYDAAEVKEPSSCSNPPLVTAG